MTPDAFSSIRFTEEKGGKKSHPDSLQAEPIKTWGSSNAENKANYGGTSAFNLKKPGMQQDLRSGADDF